MHRWFDYLEVNSFVNAIYDVYFTDEDGNHPIRKTHLKAVLPAYWHLLVIVSSAARDQGGFELTQARGLKLCIYAPFLNHLTHYTHLNPLL